MNSQRQNFFRSLSVLNSLLILVFFLFLIDVFNLSVLSKFHFIFTFFILGILKIYCLSAISGSVLEVLSGEEYVLRVRRIHQNAKDLWQGFLIVFVMIRLVDFFLFSFFPEARHWRPIYFSLFGIIAIFALAQWAIRKKYLRPLNIPQRALKISLSFLAVIIAAYVLELVLMRASDFIHIRYFYWKDITAFFSNYIDVFIFIFCSMAILDAYPEIKEKFSSPKEIFLINPMGDGVVHSLVFLVYWYVARSYPPFFVVLKALSPQNYKFREFNRVIWHERYYKKDVLVCITCFTSNCYEAYKIAKEFRKRGAKVVMGGPHVTYMPEEALVFCDSVVIGGAEGVWKDVVRDYEQGTLKVQYKAAASEADYAQVHQELLNSPPQIIKEFLETTRGCKFRCHFCTIPALSGGQVRTQSINDLVDLVQKIKPFYKWLVFIDNNIYSDPGYARDLFTALKPLKIKWQSMCTIDIAKNEETLKLARESGCIEFLLGYEIFSGSSEKNQGGKFGMAQKYIEYTKTIKKTGININGRFIFGFDSDNFRSLLAMWKFCFTVMPMFTVVSMLTPLPGSGVYQDMLAQDRIINLNWRSYTSGSMVVNHPQLDHHLMNFLFPWIQIFLFMTTSMYGIMFLAIVLSFIPLLTRF